MSLRDSPSVRQRLSSATWRHYVLAVLATIAAVGLRIALTPWVHDRPTLILFTLPIALSAYLGGLGPGLLCTGLVTLASLFFVLPATLDSSMLKPGDIAQLALLVVVGLVLSVMNDTKLRALSGLNGQPGQRPLMATVRKVQGSFAFALACLIAVSGVSYFSLLRLTDDARMVAQTREVLAHLGTLRELTREAQEARQAFIVSADDSFLQSHLTSLQSTQREIDLLRRLTSDNPTQQPYVTRLASLVEEQQSLGARISEARRHGGQAAANQLAVTDGAQTGAALSEQLSAMTAIEQRLLDQRESDARASNAFARLTIIVGGVLACLLVAGALFAIRRDLAGRLSAEAELERFFSLSLDFLCISSGDGYFKRVSPAVTDMLGWSVEEFLREPYLHWIHPGDHAATLREVERQMTRGEVVLKFENRYRHKDGSWRVLSWRSMPQPDGLMYATARDVTDVKAVEHALREAKETLEVRVTERTAELAHANEALQEQLARLALLSRITHAIGERQDIGSVFGIVVATIEEQLPSDFACILTYDEADQALSVASLGPHAASLSAQPVGMRTIAKDASGLASCLHGELLYEAQLAAPAAPFLRELANLGLASLVAAPLRSEAKVVGVLLAGRRATQGFTAGERDFLRQLSEHVALAAHQAQLHGALQTAYDDLRLSQQTVMQQERLRVLGQMASGIAHDINNAISPVPLYTKMLERERGISEQGRDFLRVIQQSVRDVSDTVARMREFYRPVDSAQAFTAVQLNTMLPELVHLTRARWSDMPQERGIVVRMQLELGANLPAVRGIESEIREALTNLIFNAVDAMPDGGTVTLRTANGQAGSSPTPTVDVEVTDTGIGMDPQTLRRCLEPFFTTKGERGSGLGLAMVYGTVQRHGGNIAIDSQPGHGTTVRLTFLAASGDERSSGLVDEPVAVPPLRILIVDDDAVVLKALRDMLEAEGHRVVAFGDGRKAIEAFTSKNAAEPFDAVITDLGMPYVDGRQVAAAVKAASPTTPVIMLTGWGRLMAESDVPRHVDRMLAKPPKVRELQSALASFVAATATTA